MIYTDLRDFISQLQEMGELKRVSSPVSPHLEMTEVCDRVLRAGGPALLFEHPTGFTMPVLGNLFGTPKRVALGMGADDVSELRKIGHVLARLKEPEPPKGFKVIVLDHQGFGAQGLQGHAGHGLAGQGGVGHVAEGNQGRRLPRDRVGGQ